MNNNHVHPVFQSLTDLIGDTRLGCSLAKPAHDPLAQARDMITQLTADRDTLIRQIARKSEVVKIRDAEIADLTEQRDAMAQELINITKNIILRGTSHGISAKQVLTRFGYDDNQHAEDENYTITDRGERGVLR
jgi:hypothetical protein